MFKIGDVIRTYRVQLGYSQEELCFGICSTSNLSKIENGLQTPSRSKFEALMQRMGKSPDIFPSFFDEKESKLFKLKHDIRQHISYRRYDEANEMLLILEMEQGLDNIFTQFVKYNRAIILRSYGVDLSMVLSRLLSALNMTVPDFDIKRILSYLLTREEIAIINNIAIVNSQLGFIDKAICIYYGLKEYLEEKVVDSNEKATSYVLVLYNLSKYLGQKQHFQESVDICNTGIEYCHRFGKLSCYPELLFNKGYCLNELGKPNEAEKFIIQAYIILQSTNDYDLSQIVLDYCKAQLKKAYQVLSSFGGSIISYCSEL